jgi:hypothetical protein
METKDTEDAATRRWERLVEIGVLCLEYALPAILIAAFVFKIVNRVLQ